MQKKWMVVSVLAGVVVISSVTFAIVKMKNGEANNPVNTENLSEQVTEEKSSADQPSRSNETVSSSDNVSNSVNVKFESLKYQTSDKVKNKTIKVNINIQYPVIENKNNSKVIDKINSDIKSASQKDFSEVKNSFSESLKIIKSSEEINDASGELPFSYSVTCSVARNKNGILSVKRSGEFSAGGPLCVYAMSTNYNLNNGKELTVSDVIKGDISNINKMLGKEVTKYFAKEAKDRKLDFNDYFKEYDAGKYVFHLTDNSIVFDFSRYELGEGALGSPSVEIPFSTLKNEYKLGVLIS